MQRIISLVVVAALGFYVLWPAWSGYVIRNAVQARDPAGLAAKVPVGVAMTPTDLQAMPAAQAPAVVVICGADAPPAYPGVPGREPDAALARDWVHGLTALHALASGAAGGGH